MLKYVILLCGMCLLAFAEPPIHGVKPTNVLGTSDQHASFSFIRPGLTQTAFAFSGPSSHQSFSSSIGNAHLAQRVFPNVANALAYRNPGLGVYPVGPIAHGYANAPVAPSFVSPVPAPLPYQTPVDPASALAYYQQLQQYQQPQYSAASLYQAQLAQLLALRQAQAQAQAQAQVQAQEHVQPAQAQVPEQVQLQQQEQQQQTQNLLGIAYSSAPSVARVKVSGNGYKFDF